MQSITSSRTASDLFKDRLLTRLSIVRQCWANIFGAAAGSPDEASPKLGQQDRTRKGKILFIQPKSPATFWGLELSGPYAGYRFFHPPLGLLTLAGLTPADYDVELRDENLGFVQYPTDADIVALTGNVVYPFQVERLKVLSEFFRGQGKLICIGGPVASLMPECARPYCDVLLEGEGEKIWPQFLTDYENGQVKNFYQQVEKIDMRESPIPRIDLINVHDYAIGSVQTTRGCPFTCEFCDIIVMFGRKVRTKPINQVIRELELWADAGQQFIMFADDNFVGNRPYVKELLREVVRFNCRRRYPVYFCAQASIDTAKDKELLELLRAANFFSIFVGIESPRKESLSETLKVQNVHTTDLAEAIHTIQSYGLLMAGGMIVGFDHDDKEIFEEQYDFLQRAGVPFSMMNVLTAVPKTPLYDRLKESGRIRPYSEDMVTNVQPAKMSYEELANGYVSLVKRVFSYDALLERFLTNIFYMRNHNFPHDRPRPRWRHVVGSLRTLKYYLLTDNRERRSFFFRMIWGTMKLNARALPLALRSLVSFIHLHEYAQTKVLVVEISTESAPKVPVTAP